MTERDVRWEKIQATVGTPGIWYDELEDGTYLDVADWVEFFVEVVWDKTIYYARHRVHKDDFKDIRVDLYKIILNQMVRTIDRHMEEACESKN